MLVRSTDQLLHWEEFLCKASLLVDLVDLANGVDVSGSADIQSQVEILKCKIVNSVCGQTRAWLGLNNKGVNECVKPFYITRNRPYKALPLNKGKSCSENYCGSIDGPYLSSVHNTRARTFHGKAKTRVDNVLLSGTVDFLLKFS